MASTSDRPHANYNDNVVCSPEVVQLDVGGRKFKTTRGTLCDGSGYFKTFFSGNWSIEKQDDGSIFVDADPDVFNLLLRYLRTGVFPLDFDPARGHNYDMYNRLEQAADYYEIPMLHSWLISKLYLKCVVYRTEMKAVENPNTGLYGPTRWKSTQISNTANAEHEIISFNAEMVKLDMQRSNTWKCPCDLRRSSSCMDCNGGWHADKVAPLNNALDFRETTTYAEYSKIIELHKGWCSDTS